MIFSEKSIKDILEGRKTQHRVVVKKGEIWSARNAKYKEQLFSVLSSKQKVKWQVGKDYAVQIRGKSGLWYCPKCKIIIDLDKTEDAGWEEFDYGSAHIISCNCRKEGLDLFERYGSDLWKPFRIKITGIRKERLLDVSEEDTKKEGFRKRGIEVLKAFVRDNARDKFIEYFNKINGKKDEWVKTKEKGLVVKMWNPKVWVLEFRCLNE